MAITHIGVISLPEDKTHPSPSHRTTLPLEHDKYCRDNNIKFSEVTREGIEIRMLRDPTHIQKRIEYEKLKIKECENEIDIRKLKISQLGQQLTEYETHENSKLKENEIAEVEKHLLKELGKVNKPELYTRYEPGISKLIERYEALGQNVNNFLKKHEGVSGVKIFKENNNK